MLNYMHVNLYLPNTIVGLYCETYENIGGVAVEHNPTLIYGLCEHGTANGTVAPPGVAVEGGR